MSYPQLKKTWGMPFLLAVLILFGLMAALLGTGYWYWAAWMAMIIPLIIMVWKIVVKKTVR